MAAETSRTSLARPPETTFVRSPARLEQISAAAHAQAAETAQTSVDDHVASAAESDGGSGIQQRAEADPPAHDSGPQAARESERSHEIGAQLLSQPPDSPDASHSFVPVRPDAGQATVPEVYDGTGLVYAAADRRSGERQPTGNDTAVQEGEPDRETAADGGSDRPPDLPKTGGTPPEPPDGRSGRSAEQHEAKNEPPENVSGTDIRAFAARRGYSQDDTSVVVGALIGPHRWGTASIVSYKEYGDTQIKPVDVRRGEYSRTLTGEDKYELNYRQVRLALQTGDIAKLQGMNPERLRLLNEFVDSNEHPEKYKDSDEPDAGTGQAQMQETLGLPPNWRYNQTRSNMSETGESIYIGSTRLPDGSELQTHTGVAERLYGDEQEGQETGRCVTVSIDLTDSEGSPQMHMQTSIDIHTNSNAELRTVDAESAAKIATERTLADLTRYAERPGNDAANQYSLEIVRQLFGEYPMLDELTWPEVEEILCRVLEQYRGGLNRSNAKEDRLRDRRLAVTIGRATGMSNEELQQIHGYERPFDVELDIGQLVHWIHKRSDRIDLHPYRVRLSQMIESKSQRNR